MSLKIQYCSDLHLEFRHNKQFLLDHPIPAEGDILILAGDIVPFSMIAEHRDFFDDVSKKFRHTYWIAGNHEFYRSDIRERSGSFQESIRKNVTLLNNRVIELPKVRLILSTLWSKISPQNSLEIQYSVTDFYAIKNGDRKFTPDDFNRLHEESLEFLKASFADKTGKKSVVVTHHVPTLKNYPEKFERDYLNEAFVVELHDLILESETDYWIYGHIHENTPEFKIGKTSLLTSQLGYVAHEQHELFNARTCIEIA